MGASMMADLRDPASHPPSADADDHPDSERSSLIPDPVEDVAHGMADSARSVSGQATRTAHAVTSATGQATGQASDQLVELGHAARRDDPRHWRALSACIIAAVATAIDPPILQATSSGVQGALHVAPEAAATLVGVYYLIQAAMMVAGGVLGDVYGIKRVLLIGLASLVISSLVTATASTFPMLVVGSVAMSLSTAVVVPLSLASVLRTFGQRVLPVAIALYLTIQLLASLLAPALANFLFDGFGMGATFVPALAATLLAVTLVKRWLVADAERTRMNRVDALSYALWALGMLALVYGLVAFAGGWGRDHEVAIILGFCGLLWAIARLARGHTPIHVPDLPFRVLGVTLITGAVLGLAQSGSLLQLSNFLKGVQGYGDIASGVAIAPFAFATLIASLAMGAILTRRYRGSAIELHVFRRPITAGLVLVTVSLLLFSLLETDTAYLLIGVALAILGTGASIANVPRTDLLFRSVRSDRVGVAAGLNGSSFLLGGALGNVAVTAVIAVSSAAVWQSDLVAGGMTEDQAAAVYDAAQRATFLFTANPYAEPSYLDVASQVPGWDAVFTAGFTGAMLVLAVITGVTAAVALMGLRKRRVTARVSRMG